MDTRTDQLTVEDAVVEVREHKDGSGLSASSIRRRMIYSLCGFFTCLQHEGNIVLQPSDRGHAPQTQAETPKFPRPNSRP